MPVHHPDGVSDACISLITRPEFDSCRLTAYLCPAKMVTIGYGHVILPKFDWHHFRQCDASRVSRIITECQAKGFMTNEATTVLRISLSSAKSILESDVNTTARIVSSITQVELNQHQFDALVSLVFNIGQGNYAASTLRKLLTRGDYSGAAAEFDKWCSSTVDGRKRKLPGLVKRRELERKLFEGNFNEA